MRRNFINSINKDVIFELLNIGRINWFEEADN